ncbi:iron chelate uptake ABC transporter family permease subunit [bacterium]|nr:iron chelate uptake ABC transporter family permease subunit [bacterium]MBU3955788.1 iron chelate uptake ABC transporter family permease subunit [bacterium]
MMKNKQKLILFALVLGLLLTMLATLTIGPVHIPAGTVVKIIFSKIFAVPQTWPDNFQQIVLNVRLPRILLAVLAGCALSVSGCAMQGLFRNPMASPYICGVASGGAFGASLIIAFNISHLLIIPTAFFFALLAVFLVYNLARAGNKIPVETLLLSGIALSLFFSALTSFVQYVSKEGELRQIIFWLMGGFWASSWNKVLGSFPVIFTGVLGIFFFSRELNILLIGEDQAQDMGVEVEITRKAILILSALVTASAVAACGIIGFVGLIIPHIMRIIIGPDHRFLLPASAVCGSIFLVWVDTFARTLISPTELPVGIITALIGVPFFLFLLKTRKKLSGF